MKVRNLSSTCFKIISACVLKAIKNLAQADQVKVEMLFSSTQMFVCLFYVSMIEEPDQVVRSQVAGLQLVCFRFSFCFFFFQSFSNLSEASAVSLVLF